MLDVVTAARDRPRGRSQEARRLYDDLMAVCPDVRRGFMKGLGAADLRQVLKVADQVGGTPFSFWRDDPVGFVFDVLRETMWSRPVEILRSLVTNRRTAVPSCFSSGKTHSAARAALWWAYTNPPGTALVVTMAPQWRQVIRLLWPEIRAAHSRAGLPGTADMAQLKIPNRQGMEYVVAYGLAAPPWNEVAVQGIHSPRPFLVIDEAGGLSHVIGNNVRGMLVGDEARLLAIGNPPADEEGSWFEELCAADGVNVLPISAYSTPGLAGTDAPRCRTCMDDHTVAKHLVDPAWVAEAIAENGEDSNYVIAKVHARFPRGGPSRALPSLWVDNAAESDEPLDDVGAVRLCDLGLPEEMAPWLVRRGDWVRLGVDVAADGGDELVVARAVGDLLTIEHTSSGAANDNAVHVAGVVLKHIRQAEALRQRLRVTKQPPKVRVKIDGIGVGWGVASTLQAWANEGVHDAEIVVVVVSEGTGRDVPEAATLRPYRKRDEMWLAMRSLLQPGPGHEDGRVRLRVARKCLAQLRAPKLSTSSTGYTIIESKQSLRERGVSSPDRAEAALLAVYEPVLKLKRRKSKLIA
uniref:hypothetical protein n=1 Tax=Nonomuraea sp. CA-251285 TaxID=3240002 RepID=UPI003F493D4D